MNSPTVNSLFQDRTIPKACSSVSVVVERKFLICFCIAKNEPPRQHVTKLFFVISLIPCSDVNHIRELQIIVTRPSVTICSHERLEPSPQSAKNLLILVGLPEEDKYRKLILYYSSGFVFGRPIGLLESFHLPSAWSILTLSKRLSTFRLAPTLDEPLRLRCWDIFYIWFS